MIEATAAACAGLRPGAPDHTRAVHHALQRMLPCGDVVIPYAPAVARQFDRRRVDARRHFGHLLHLVKAIALLHARQRARDFDGNLLAAPVDYQIAAYLAKGPLGRAAGGLSDSARAFHKRLADRFRTDAEFTTRDAGFTEAAKPSTVYAWLAALSDANLVEQTQASQRRPPGDGTDPGRCGGPRPALAGGVDAVRRQAVGTAGRPGADRGGRDTDPCGSSTDGCWSAGWNFRW